MKKFLLSLILLFGVLCLQSCASARINKVYITDYNEQMEYVRIHFPQIYNLYTQGKVVINGVYEYTEKKTGQRKVNVSYYYR